jgi:2-methylaconitate cis-trans-isomerase PrpF
MFEAPNRIDVPAMYATVAVPCTLMRGGSSRGPFFVASDLPADVIERDALLLSLMGSGHALQVDGIGGGNPLTSKVAIVGPPTVRGADVDYLFAQVDIGKPLVDTSPNCGNMLAAVAPFAIDKGLVAAKDGTTCVRIHNVNTGAIVEAEVSTPEGMVCYDGDVAIDGVNGTAAPIYLSFLEGTRHGGTSLWPTGRRIDCVLDTEVTCVDAAIPIVLIRAADLGKTGFEKPALLDADLTFMTRLEAVRRAAGRLMGIADVEHRVIPKPVLVAASANRSAIVARYFMPHACHTAFAVTGAVSLSTASSLGGTVLDPLIDHTSVDRTFVIEHPSGTMRLALDRADPDPAPRVSLIRTARRLFEGMAFGRIPVGAAAVTAPPSGIRLAPVL